MGLIVWIIFVKFVVRVKTNLTSAPTGKLHELKHNVEPRSRFLGCS